MDKENNPPGLRRSERLRMLKNPPVPVPVSNCVNQPLENLSQTENFEGASSSSGMVNNSVSRATFNPVQEAVQNAMPAEGPSGQAEHSLNGNNPNVPNENRRIVYNYSPDLFDSNDSLSNFPYLMEPNQGMASSPEDSPDIISATDDSRTTSTSSFDFLIIPDTPFVRYKNPPLCPTRFPSADKAKRNLSKALEACFVRDTSDLSED